MVAWDERKINYAEVKSTIAKEIGQMPSSEDINFFCWVRGKLDKKIGSHTHFACIIKSRNEHYGKLSQIIHFYSRYLTEIHCIVVHFRLGDSDHPSLTLKEVGEKLDITGSRVRQIEQSALFNIERMMTGKQICSK